MISEIGEYIYYIALVFLVPLPTLRGPCLQALEKYKVVVPTVKSFFHLTSSSFNQATMTSKYSILANIR